MSVKEEQPQKTLLSIEVTLLGIVTEVKEVQFPYLQISFYQLFTYKTVEK